MIFNLLKLLAISTVWILKLEYYKSITNCSKGHFKQLGNQNYHKKMSKQTIITSANT